MKKNLVVCGWGVAASLATVSCQKDPGEGSAEAVEQAGYELSTAAYFRAAGSDDLEALRRMRSAGLSLETRDDQGRTALHAAAGAGAILAVDFFLDQGLETDVVDDAGRTPLMEAVLRSSPEMVRHLLAQGADPQAKDHENYKPLMLAVREGREEMVSELAPYVRQQLDDALLAASILGQPEVIDELTNFGASVYVRYEDGRTPLMLAAQYGQAEAVEMLLAIGANRYGMDEQGRTAGDLAREAGHPMIARRLAEGPMEGDFELREPAELGAEMLARVEPGADSPPPPRGAGGSGEPGEGMILENGAVREASGVEDDRPIDVPPLEGAVVGAPGPRADPGDSTGSAGSGELAEIDGSTASGAGEAAPERTAVRDRAAEPELDRRVGGNRASEPRGSSAGKPSGRREVSAESGISPEAPVVMRAYREKELPLRVESTGEGVARMKVAGGEPVEVEEGAVVPGSQLKLIRIERRMRSGKDRSGELREVSVVTLEDGDSGVTREIVVGLPALAHDPVALVEDSASGRYYVARAGQRFQAADGTEYVVGDVRPSQMIIENTGTGETTTLSLRGWRG